MTKGLRTSLLILMLTLFVSVSHSQESGEEPNKMISVMASHDEVMNDMPKLSKLINKLTTRANASYKKEKYELAIKNLKAANQSMVSWMENFSERFDADEMMKGKQLTEEKKKWLLEEEKKIALLKEEIDLSISQAERILNN
ncbi:hypothetical protein D1013_19735 [Euzebyella marina]|uniref:Viral A-type inclusion protein n=1 Tax=Euzebyella marina TaxID=1761453 RepID=A0A3G2LB24_9FLAO|nr:hypothetical protein [Euzebyella marina]AYN69454.1 hypothetical protein D1013_19735 [Euzebyella marina]